MHMNFQYSLVQTVTNFIKGVFLCDFHVNFLHIRNESPPRWNFWTFPVKMIWVQKGSKSFWYPILWSKSTDFYANLQGMLVFLSLGLFSFILTKIKHTWFWIVYIPMLHPKRMKLSSFSVTLCVCLQTNIAW